MLSFQADYVFPVSSPIIKNGIVSVDESGKLIAIHSETESRPESPITKLNGIICPGFVNAHCQLELSHLKTRIEPGSGFVKSLLNRIALSNIPATDKLLAARKADSEMFEHGIVAAGDITSSIISKSVKADSKIIYHSFIEIANFDPKQALSALDEGLALLNEFKYGSCSITPQAPYSVSKALFKLIKDYCDSNLNAVSMNNQQSNDEERFFRYKEGIFNDFYAALKLDISHFKAQARNSIQSVNALLSKKQKIMLVYNTRTNLKDIYFLKRFDTNINYCFCPNASLYAENLLPKIPLFINQGSNIMLGTGSLGENTQLCLLAEMKTIQQNFPEISTEMLIQWGTINGANYFELENKLGTLEPGKIPGLNLISDLDGLKLTAESKVKKLI